MNNLMNNLIENVINLQKKYNNEIYHDHSKCEEISDIFLSITKKVYDGRMLVPEIYPMTNVNDFIPSYFSSRTCRPSIQLYEILNLEDSDKPKKDKHAVECGAALIPDTSYDDLTENLDTYINRIADSTSFLIDNQYIVRTIGCILSSGMYKIVKNVHYSSLVSDIDAMRDKIKNKIKLFLPNFILCSEKILNVLQTQVDCAPLWDNTYAATNIHCKGRWNGFLIYCMNSEIERNFKLFDGALIMGCKYDDPTCGIMFCPSITISEPTEFMLNYKPPVYDMTKKYPEFDKLYTAFGVGLHHRHLMYNYGLIGYR